jgi:hypothetical protein
MLNLLMTMKCFNQDISLGFSSLPAWWAAAHCLNAVTQQRLKRTEIKSWSRLGQLQTHRWRGGGAAIREEWAGVIWEERRLASSLCHLSLQWHPTQESPGTKIVMFTWSHSQVGTEQKTLQAGRREWRWNSTWPWYVPHEDKEVCQHYSQ